MFRKIKIALASVALVSALSLNAQTYYSVPLPFTTLTGGNVINGGLTNNTVTNLSSGWAAITSYTNVTTLWNSSSNAFISTTNTTSVTNTTYADFEALGREFVALQYEFTASGSSVSNAILTIARSVTRGNFDTLNNLTWTNAANGATRSVGVYQLDMRGYPYGRIVSFTWGSTNQAQLLTNGALYVSSANLRQNGQP